MAAKQNESPNFDEGLIQAAIGKNSEIHLVKGIKLELKGGDKVDSRILVVTSFRFFILTAGRSAYKVDLSVHILDIHAIESKKPEQIVIHYGEKQVKFCLSKPGSIHVVVAHLIANLKINFPGGNLDELVRKNVEPVEKLESISNVVNKLTSAESLAEAGPCGGFSRSYACICDHMGVPLVDEVAWDVDTIYLSNDTKEFNIQDFDHLEPRELIPIVATLEYNAWFTKLVCVSYKLSAEILDVITKVIKRSTTIGEIVLDGVSLGREFCQKLATALTSNPKSALDRIDLSRNPSAEDRGIIHLVGGFSKLSHGLDSLNLHETGITNKGAVTIGQMLKSSKYMSVSLTRLNLSNNLIKADGVTAICDFLAQANALTHVDLSSTECFVENIFGALIRGCCQNLSHLDLSGNHFSHRKSKDSNISSSFKKFFSSTAALKEIKLSDCRLPADAARAMFGGLIDNDYVKEVSVDISKNELKTAGLRAITEPLSQIGNLYSLDLSENGFESDLIQLCESLCENKALKKLYIGQNCPKGRNLNNIMEGLIKLVSVENSPIEFLSLAESRLKQSITLLFDSLGTNESLVELDISGNLMGDEGARVLAKALQINSKLRTIHWDRNSVTQSGFRDIAQALENNLTLQSMPIPVNDVSLCLKPATEKALKQIEKCLFRNHSPSQAVTEQAYRLQQGLMQASSQQQMVDKLIVQLQDTTRILRNSPDETIISALRNALRCINDADKLKQLFLKFHMCTRSKNMEERLSSLASDIYNSIQQQMEENVVKILECTESNCPFVTDQQGVKENLKTACEGKANVSKAFIDTVLLQKLSPVILNEVSEKNLNVSTIVVDTLMDEVISQLEQQQSKLNILVQAHKNQEKAEEKSIETEEHNDNVSEAAQKAKNRLSVANNRRSTRLPDGESEAMSAPSHPRRRPTISRKRKTSETAEDRADSDSRSDVKKKEPAVTGLDMPAAVEETPKELVHVTKNRPRPARGRRPPTRASGGPQNSVAGPEIVVDNFDDGIDSFFNQPATRPKSAALPTSMSVVPEPAIAKSATVSSHRPQNSKKKHDKEEGEDNHKEPQEKKKHGILGGLFKKKSSDKKSPSSVRKESKKEQKKNLEDITSTDRGAPSEKKEPNLVQPSLATPAEVTKPKQPTHEKPEKQPKRPPERPQRPEKHVANEPEKPVQPETKPAQPETKPAQPEMKPETTEMSSEPAKEKTEEGEKKENGGKKETVDGKPSNEDAVGKPKPQPKTPPKFGVGLPMGGDLLAEMKKRNERNQGGMKVSAEAKLRQRLGTNPDLLRPVVPARPSSMKRNVKSAADLVSSAQDGKPVPQPKPKPGEHDKDKRRLSNESGKPVPPKPIKEKPHVPKRPPSISRNRGNSQKEDVERRESLDAEKPKSIEAETAVEEKPKSELAEPVEKVESSEGKQTTNKVEEEVFGKPVEKLHENKEPGDKLFVEKPTDKSRTEKVEKAETDEKVSVNEKLEDKRILQVSPEKDHSKTPNEDKTPPQVPPEKDTSKTSDENTPSEKPTETEAEDEDVTKASILDSTQSSTAREEAKETDADEANNLNDVLGKPKDTNDNETGTTGPSKDSTTKAEPLGTDVEGDDVIKSSVDKDLLEEVLASKDTSL